MADKVLKALSKARTSLPVNWDITIKISRNHETLRLKHKNRMVLTLDTKVQDLDNCIEEMIDCANDTQKQMDLEVKVPSPFVM